MNQNPAQFSPSRGPEVLILSGLQGAGKSTFVGTLLPPGYAHVSRDRFPNNRDKPRRERHLIEEALGAGRPVVVDNTHARRTDRAGLIALARAHRVPVRCVYFDAALKDCLRRNLRRAGKARVPAVGVVATQKRFEPPAIEEGFDALWVARLNEAAGGFELVRIVR